MNRKILVEIVIPAAGQKFDVRIPWDSRMGEVTALTATALSELSDGKFRADTETVLCDAETGQIYDINMTVAEHEIRIGARLMLI